MEYSKMQRGVCKPQNSTCLWQQDAAIEAAIDADIDADIDAGKVPLPSTTTVKRTRE
jgi:hypothetical protein